MANILKKYIAGAGKAKTLMWQAATTEQYMGIRKLHYMAGLDFIARTNILTTKELGTLVEYIGTIPNDGELLHMETNPRATEAIELIMAEMIGFYDSGREGEAAERTELIQSIKDRQVLILRAGGEYIYIDIKFSDLMAGDVIALEHFPRQGLIHAVILDDYAKDASREIAVFIRTLKIEEEHQSQYLANLEQMIFNV